MLNQLRSLASYQEMLAALDRGEHIPSLGLLRSARMPLIAALHQDLKVPILLIADRMDRALVVMDELGYWSPGSQRIFFAEPTPLFYEPAAWGNTARRDRLHALTMLASYQIPGASLPVQPPIIITTVRGLMTRTLPRRDFIKTSKLVRIKQIISPETLLRILVDTGYSASDVVVEPGQFSRRGGLLDIWAPAESHPARVEFFGDEVDTLRLFDPSSQRKISNTEKLLITPAREVLPGKAAEAGITPADLNEFYIPLVHRSPASLLDYLPQKAYILLGELDMLEAVANEIEEQALRMRSENVESGVLPDDFPAPYLSWSELNDSLESHIWLGLGYSAADESSMLAKHFTPGTRYGGRLKPILDELVQACQKDEKIYLVSRQVSRLQELWKERTVETCIDQAPEFMEGSLTEGFTLDLDDGGKIRFLTDSEIFGWERPQTRQRHRPSAEAPETSYLDLRPGDWVVHVDYGIGRYSGLVRRILDGSEREFLCIEYDGGDQLYVPVHQADRLSRYIGPDANPPNATRLGTAEWTQAKQKVREEVLKVAQDLLDLYAKRQVATGYKFQNDTIWQQELEASFPYVETQDQMTAIQAVKNDMENSRPMDRLLCGDVGYGKTEVALRAAFKAVMDGKQVAILVPTTVLAQQHYETFRQRLSAYPVVVEMLSRFRTPREQDEILIKLAFGEVDIVIGTHRLIQVDVQFKDLGLVIIDEEQRFGVAHKEHFKKLRTEVDVLTLTATPIPRTLYMALTGVRDISTINTPPEERLPIITHIGPYSPRLARQAILRELERGGQIFFVHNRVQTIRAMQMHLENLVPEARIGVGHGQMPEGHLSNVMKQFTAGEIDVLLCTSIIESGLDIPNANTLIVDRGDTFGLAQLYQLRGRVGRGAQRAYAYFFRHRKKPPTPEGQERLEVIAENTQLGSGYSIAMRDLEMRGAGELLGTQQHGYIASVGFHLYTRLLAQAVRHIRKITPQPVPEAKGLNIQELRMAVTVELPMPVGIPIEYVDDQNLRLSLYRRIAESQSEMDIDALREEFVDRFGLIPESVDNLFYQMRVKILAQDAGLVSVSVESEQIVLRFPALPEGAAPRNLPPLGPMIRAGKNTYWMTMNRENNAWQQDLLNALKALV